MRLVNQNKTIKNIFFAMALTCLSPLILATNATLNLKETDIQVFIESVSRITGKTFIIDPRVKNKKVTVISQHEMNEDEIFALFLSVLQVHQFSAVETNGYYKIEQLQAAKQDSVPVYVEGGKKYTGDQIITRIIKVDNVDVGQLMPLLRSLISTQGHMAQYKPTNVMVLHDTASNIERIVKVIRQIDRESNEDFEVIALQHASASEVVRILESIEKKSGTAKGAETNKSRFVADERTNSILLSANKKSSMRLRALIARLDSEMDSNGNTKVVHLKYASAEDLATLLEGVGESIETDDTKDKSKATRRGGNDKDYSIKAHQDTNSLVITATPDLMRSFESVIRQLDTRPLQVHVEAIIVEVSDEKAKELGVQWVTEAGIANFTNSGVSMGGVVGGVLANRGQEGTTTVSFPDGVRTEITTPNNGDNGQALAGVLAGATGILAGFTNNKSWAGLLNILSSDADSNILSTPSLTTLDNEEASISIGQEIPVITGSTLGNNNSNPFQNVERKDVGIKLKITPQINEGDAVRLVIEQEVSSVSNAAVAAGIITNKRQIKTVVLAQNGQTIVLGGLIDDNIRESVQKIPLLGDIPWIGRLFSSTTTNKSKSNLMVFIRPTIIGDVAGFDAVSSKKYNYMRAQQLDWKQRGISLMPATNPAVMPQWDVTLALPPSFDDAQQKADKNESADESQTHSDNQ